MRTNSPNMLSSCLETTDMTKIGGDKPPLHEDCAQSLHGNCPNLEVAFSKALSWFAQVAPRLLALTKQFAVNFFLLSTMEHSWCLSGRNFIKGSLTGRSGEEEWNLSLLESLCLETCKMTRMDVVLWYQFTSWLRWMQGILFSVECLGKALSRHSLDL